MEVDLGRLEENVKAILAATRHGEHHRRGDAPAGLDGSVLCAVIKKNGYGLGALPLARRLATAGAGMLAVYSTAEAEELVNAGITLPILVLMPIRGVQRNEALYRAAAAGRLHLTLHDTPQADALDSAGRNLGLRLPVHLHVDTGMAREGMTADEASALLARCDTMRGLRIAGVMTHMATADSDPAFTRQQHDRFEDALRRFGDRLPDDVLIHVANSYALLRDRRYHRHLVRPGIGLLGYAAEALAPGPVVADAPGLRPIVRWCSRLVHVQRYPGGTPVGYGSTHTLGRDSVLGVVPVGYGDGYPLALSNRGVVRLALPRPGGGPGETLAACAVVGRVNMDQLTIDLTDALAAAGLRDPLAALFATVELYGDDPAAPNALHRLAGLAHTHCYELVCRLNPRLTRRYLH